MRWGAERPLLRQYMRVRYVATCESSPVHLLPFIASRRSALQSSGRGLRDGEEGRRPPARALAPPLRPLGSGGGGPVAW